MGKLLKEMQTSMSNDPHKDWKPQLNRLNSQITLRILSSIQLANKVCSSDLVRKITIAKILY